MAALERVKANLKRYRAAVLKAAVEGKLTAEWRTQHPDTEPASKLLDRILKARRRKWEETQLAKYATTGKSPPKGWREKYSEPVAPNSEARPALPSTWCWATMDQVIRYLKNGYFQSPTGATSGHRILRINAVRPMRVDLNEVRYLERLSSDSTGYYVEDGDLLFTRYNGSVELLGVAGLVRGWLQPTLHPDKLICVRTVVTQPLPAFLQIGCNVGESRRHMVSRARTTAGQTGISGVDIREMPIPLPPLAEQSEIVADVERRLSIVDELEAQVGANLKRAGRLRQSILKRAFAGRLVPQDPTDEPAAKLLERIRVKRRQANSNGEPAGRRRAHSPKRNTAAQGKEAK